MIAINLLRNVLAGPCSNCGQEMQFGFDGGRDRLFEYCYRVRPLLKGEALKAWWGPGRCDEGPPVLVCDVEISPPRWLTEMLAAGVP